jgi:hypothetical protein
VEDAALERSPPDQRGVRLLTTSVRAAQFRCTLEYGAVPSSNSKLLSA